MTQTRLKTASRLAALLFAALLLEGCDGWFGDSDDAPLPGERIAILGLDTALSADPTLAGVTVVLPPPRANEAWPQIGGEPHHAMGNLAGSGQTPSPAWRRSIGASAGRDSALTGGPIIAEGRVYAMDANAQVSAYDLGSGQPIWTQALASGQSGGTFGGGIAYGDGRIYAATGLGVLFALDAATGASLWETPTLSPVRIAPAYAQGRVFVMTLDGNLRAYSTADGQDLWTHSGLQHTTGLIGGSTPAISGQSIVAAFPAGEVHALLHENGRELWSDTLTNTGRISPVSEIAAIKGAPVISDGIAFVLGYADKLIAVDLQRGLRLWEEPIGGLSTPLVVGDYVFITTNKAELVAFTKREGRIHWVRELPRYRNEQSRTGEIAWGSPVMLDGRIVVGNSAGEVWILSAQNGATISTQQLGAPLSLPPAVAGGTVLFLTDGAELVALR